MAIPQADFDRLVDSVKEEVIEAVREEIAKLPAGSSSLTPTILQTALLETSDAILEAVKQELRVFKEELITELARQYPAPATPQKQETQIPETLAEKLKRMW